MRRRLRSGPPPAPKWSDFTSASVASYGISWNTWSESMDFEQRKVQAYQFPFSYLKCLEVLAISTARS